MRCCRCGGQLGSEPYPALSCTLKGAKGVGVTVWGISLSVAQHCVAVVGHEGKQGSNSTWRLWLWDYASLELGDDDATRASSLAQQPLMALARLGSAKLNVQQLAAGGRVGTATAEGSAPSFAAAAGAAPSFSAAAGGDSLSCGAAGAVPMTPHGAALFGEATAFGDCRACKGGGVQALARFNPLRAYASRDVGLKCCAWAAGDLPGQGRVVVGSAAGWLVVVEAEAAAVAAATRTGAEHDHALVSRCCTANSIAAFCHSMVLCMHEGRGCSCIGLRPCSHLTSARPSPRRSCATTCTAVRWLHVPLHQRMDWWHLAALMAAWSSGLW